MDTQLKVMENPGFEFNQKQKSKGPNSLPKRGQVKIRIVKEIVQLGRRVVSGSRGFSRNGGQDGGLLSSTSSPPTQAATPGYASDAQYNL